MSQQGILSDLTSAGGDVETLTGNSGGAVGPDGVFNINLLGATPISVTGNPGTNTLTIDTDGTLAITYTEDVGSATPSSDNINILGGTNINTAGATDVVTINLDSDVLGLTDLTVDNLELNGNTFSSTDLNGNIFISPNGTGGVILPTNLTLGESTQDVTFSINGISIDSVVALHTEGATDLGGFVNQRHSDTAAFGVHNIYLRSRGSEAVATIVANNDILSRLVSAGFDGTDYAQSTEIRGEVDGTPGNDDMPGRLLFCTSADGAQTPLEALRLDSSQDATFSGTVTISGQTPNAVPVFDTGGLISEVGPLTDGQLVIGSTGVLPVANTLTAGTGISVTNGAGSITLDLTSNVQSTAIHGWNGSIIETTDVTVTSDGATITCNVEQNGGGDLTVVFSDGFYAWDTTPADTVSLTAGTDSAPQINYIYFLQSTKTLTNSTTGFPTAEHAPIATVIAQSAASLQTDGAYRVHVWTDHTIDINNQGHISDINAWIRSQDATWISGVGQTFAITTNVGVPDNVLLTTAIGIVRQLHSHTFPAFSGTPDYYVINDSVTPYTIVNDLNALLTDSTGASMSNKFFSLILWGVVSEDTGDSKLFINLPSGSYNNASSVASDPNGFATFDIPQDFIGTGFLIAQWNLRHQVASGGTWTSLSEIDLRGLEPGIFPGGTVATPTEFADNLFRIFDDGDPTKLLAFEISPVTTSTTRTITMVDADLDLAEVATTFVSDSGNATPAANSLNIIGGNGITTSGSGSTLTINVNDAGMTWTEVTGTSQAIAVDNGYIANNAGLVTLTLPATAVIGDIIKVDGKGAGGIKIAQNAGQTVHFLGQDTTPGVGGSLASTTQYDCITYRCITANTDFVVESVVGNWTVV